MPIFVRKYSINIFFDYKGILLAIFVRTISNTVVYACCASYPMVSRAVFTPAGKDTIRGTDIQLWYWDNSLHKLIDENTKSYLTTDNSIRLLVNGVKGFSLSTSCHIPQTALNDGE